MKARVVKELVPVKKTGYRHHDLEGFRKRQMLRMKLANWRKK